MPATVTSNNGRIIIHQYDYTELNEKRNSIFIQAVCVKSQVYTQNCSQLTHVKLILTCLLDTVIVELY